MKKKDDVKKNWKVLVYSSDEHLVDSWNLNYMTEGEASEAAEQQVKKKHSSHDDWRLIEREKHD
jgi:hypothetical protein